MAKGLTLDILADTRQAQKAIGDVGEALEAVGDSLNDVVKDSDKGTERMERDFRELSRDIKRDSKDAYTTVKRESKDAFDSSSEVSGEFRDEFKSNMSEVTSSFDGSMESIGDLAQGTLGGLVSTTIPGLGIAAASAAVGLGAIGGALTRAQEEAAATAEKVNAMFDDMIESGQRFLSETFVQDKIGEIYKDQKLLNEARQVALRLGVDEAVVVAGMAGDAEVLAGLQERSADAAAEQEAVWRSINSELYPELKQQEGERLQDLQAIGTTVGGWATDIDSAAQKAAGFTQAIDVAKQTAQEVRDNLSGIPKDLKIKLNIDRSDLDRALTNAVANVQLRINATDRYGRNY